MHYSYTYVPNWRTANLLEVSVCGFFGTCLVAITIPFGSSHKIE